MNSIHYVNALFIMERSKDAKTLYQCIDYVVDELLLYSEEDTKSILNHLTIMMLEYYRDLPHVNICTIDEDPC
jgi:hypothetical protein